MSSIQCFVQTGLQSFYDFKSVIKWSLQQSCSKQVVPFKEGLFQKECFSEIFVWSVGHFPSTWKWRKGHLLRPFSKSSTGFHLQSLRTFWPHPCGVFGFLQSSRLQQCQTVKSIQIPFFHTPGNQMRCAVDQNCLCSLSRLWVCAINNDTTFFSMQ